MSTPRSTTEHVNRKAVSEVFLAEVLRLNDPWIERWEENGTWREESRAPDRLPRFIRGKLDEDEIATVERKVDQLVAAGCQRSVVYFCLQQLSPAAEWSRSGGHLEGVRAQQGEELVSQKQNRPIATREDMATVASNARAARKEIHRYKYELSFAAEALRATLPVGFSTRTETPEDAVLLLESALSWVAKLADAYAAPMVSTLIKSKGLLYLTMYVGRYADERKLRGQRTDSVLADSKKASGGKRARKTHLPAANVLANLLSMIMGTDQSWSPSELKEKVESFRQDYPRLHRLLDQRLSELHRFASQ
jgi:hypothetical protein